MRQQSGKTATGTDIQQVKQQNNQFAAGKGMSSTQFGSEFGSEKQFATGKGMSSSQYGFELGSDTDVEEVKKLNQQSEANKNKNTDQYGKPGNSSMNTSK